MRKLSPIIIATILLICNSGTLNAQAPDVSYSNSKTYDMVLSYGLSPVQQKDGKYGYKFKNNTSNKLVIKSCFDMAKDFVGKDQGVVAPIQYDGKWGLIDLQGKYVVKPTHAIEPRIIKCTKSDSKFDLLIIFRGGGSNNRFLGYLGPKQVFNEPYLSEEYTSNGYLMRCKNQSIFFNVVSGQVIKFDTCEKMDKRGIAIVSVGGHWGIAYKRYDNIKYVAQDVTKIYDKWEGKYDGESIFKQCIGQGCRWLYIDNNGFPHDIGGSGGFVEINIGSTKGYIFDTKRYGNRKPGPYTGAFLVNDKGEALIVDANSIKPIQINGNEFLRVKNNKGTAFYNTRGEMIIPFNTGKIDFCEIPGSEGLIGVKVENSNRIRYGIFSLGGKEIVPVVCHTLPKKGEWTDSDKGLILFDGQKIERIIKK